jgi:hypothetical protein
MIPVLVGMLASGRGAGVAAASAAGAAAAQQQGPAQQAQQQEQQQRGPGAGPADASQGPANLNLPPFMVGPGPNQVRITLGTRPSAFVSGNKSLRRCICIRLAAAQISAMLLMR